MRSVCKAIFISSILGLVPSLSLADGAAPAPVQSLIEKRDLVITPPPSAFPKLKYGPHTLAQYSFYDGDWNSLIDSNGIRPCVDLIDRNRKSHWVSSVGSNCFAEAKKDLYADFTRRIADTELLGIERPYAVNTNASQIQKEAALRVAYRAFSDYFANDPYLSLLLSGKVAMDFSVTDIFASSGTQGSISSKPRYVLLNNEIKETWDKPVLTPNLEKEQEEFRIQRQAEQTYLARNYGWSQKPFSKYRLKIERIASAPALSSLSFRIEETADFGFLDFSSMVAGKPYTEMAATIQVPYFAHAVGLEYIRLSNSPTYFYRHHIPGNSYTRIAYDPTASRIQIDLTKLM